MRAPVSLTRGEFLRRLVSPRNHPSPRIDHPAETGGDAALPAAFMADFPPALLNEEALRLGLDPASTDRDTLLRAIHREMLRQRSVAAGAAGPSAPEPPASQTPANARR